jgi:hypothetical protein
MELFFIPALRWRLNSDHEEARMFDKEIANAEARLNQIVQEAETRLNTIVQTTLDRVNGAKITVNPITISFSLPPAPEKPG